VLYPDLDLWFTEQGVLPLENSRETVSPYAWSLFWLLGRTPAGVHACYWLTVAHAVALLVGFLPRLNAFFLFLWLVSLQTRNNLINDGEDTIMRLLAFYLIWLPSGRCWSVNALICRSSWGGRLARPGQPSMNEPSESTPPGAPLTPYAAPGWGLRLLQIQMAGMMLSTGLVKLSGEAWVNGTALYYVSRLDDHFGRFYVPAWLFDTPWIVALITWSVLAAELAVPILIWFREMRLPCLVILVAFHLANEWTMNLFLFHWLMLCGWIAFLTPADFHWLWRSAEGWRDRGRE
jgi:vitamin K-dependent gamma-carboxylase-like protein